jgi:CHAD domain-containing protein
MASGEAFRAVVHNCLRQIIANEPGVRTGDAEALHQMRIGLRRLRAAITAFTKVSSDSKQNRIKTELKAATNKLAPARDLDVFAADVFKHLSETGAGEKEFAEASRDFTLRRKKTYAALADFVRSKRFRKTLLDVAEWVETGPWTRANAGAEQPIKKHAADVLTKFRKQIRKKESDLHELDAYARHKLRIRAKKLRYMIDFFGGVFPGHKNVKRRQTALNSLKTLQDTLGRLNDIAVRKALVSDGDGLTMHVAAMVDAGEAKAEKLLEQARLAHAHFSKVKAFWKS